jgi:N-terminal domain on NACHT_NTPase and P-loop NTPases
MAEALGTLALVSSVVQIIDFGTKIIKRLDKLQLNADEIPRDLNIQLSLLRDTLTRTKAEAEIGLVDADTERAALEVVKGCQLQVRLLDEVLIKILSTPADSLWRRGTKDFHSIGQEGNIRKIIHQIQQYQISLIHHSTARRSLSLAARPKPLFTVPFAQNLRFTGRQDELKWVDERFQTHHRLALAGLGGVGYGFLLRVDLRRGGWLTWISVV